MEEGWLSVTEVKTTALVYFIVWYDPVFDLELQRGTRGGGISDVKSEMEGGTGSGMDGIRSTSSSSTSWFNS